MNILAFTNYTGSSQWRLEGPANYINANTEHEMMVMSSKLWDRQAFDEMADDVDLVVVQMWSNPTDIEYIQSKGIPVIYEADDILVGVGGKERKKLIDLSKKREELSIESYRMADDITVTTEVLADHYKKWNSNVVVLPNYLDYMWWGEPWKAKTANKQLRIGWMGSISHQEDLEFFSPIITKICNKYPGVKFVYCGHGGKKGIYGEELFGDIRPIQREYIPGVPLEYWPQKSKSLGLDIGVAPLIDDEFNSGKSPIKYFEYAANGVPGVFSNTVVYKDVVKHGETGYLVTTKAEWEECLSKLIEDHQGRQTMMINAFNDVLENYNLGDKYHMWIDAYERTCSNAS